jgi:hypothetical protein
VVVAILLIPTAWSYAHALRAPGSAPWSARTVEWISDHGGRGVVLLAERVWYSWHKPPVGGVPSGGIPTLGSEHASPVPRSVRTATPHLPRPADVVPIAAHPLPHEGAWHATGRWIDGHPSMYTAFLRPDPVHTSVLTAVAWIDTKLVRPVLVAGTQEPGGGGWPWGGKVPSWRRQDLVAAFNSGFKIGDSRGGFYADGRVGAPLVKGAASLVIYADGSATVGQWGRDVQMSPDVSAVRQNLVLIVDHGSPVPALANPSLAQWGATVGNQLYVWRSGVGVTADGALVYAAGPALSARSLATVLARAGCVRAMELDINTDWTTFNIFTPDPGSAFGVRAVKLLPDMFRPATRYLVPDERDFIALFTR